MTMNSTRMETSGRLMTTAQVIAARLKGERLHPDTEHIPMMEEHGFVCEIDKRGSLLFRRGRLHIWRIIDRSSGQMMWQTAILKDGYFIEHIPVNSLEHVCKSYSHERNINLCKQ